MAGLHIVPIVYVSDKIRNSHIDILVHNVIIQMCVALIVLIVAHLAHLVHHLVHLHPLLAVAVAVVALPLIVALVPAPGTQVPEIVDESPCHRDVGHFLLNLV